MGRRVLTFIALLGLGLLLSGSPDRLCAADQQTLEIVTKSGVHVFAVEIAVTNDERARGLMFRDQLAEGRGMLFEDRKSVV